MSVVETGTARSQPEQEKMPLGLRTLEATGFALSLPFIPLERPSASGGIPQLPQSREMSSRIKKTLRLANIALNYNVMREIFNPSDCKTKE